MKILLNKAEATALSEELRTGSGGALGRRRAIVALSAASLLSMTVISLYQTGVIPHLPEPPIPGLDADAVDASADAYAILSTPDAALGAVSYAATLLLAAADGAGRTENAPWIPLALLAKASGDAAMAAKLTVDQWTKHKAFCSWCLVAAAASFAAAPLAVPEARAAWKALRARRA